MLARTTRVCGNVIDSGASGAVTVGQNPQEQPNRAFADLPHWLRNGCQRRGGVFREADVVETDDRQLLRDVHAQPPATSGTPIAISSLKQKIAVGRSRRARRRSAAAAPDSMEKSPCMTVKFLVAFCCFARPVAPLNRSRLNGLASGPVTIPMRRCPTRTDDPWLRTPRGCYRYERSAHRVTG